MKKIIIKTLLASGLLAGSGIAAAQTACNLFLDDSTTTGVLQSATPQAMGMNPQKLALVDKLIESEVKHGFPGAGLIIIKDGKVIKQNVYGYKLKYDRETGKSLAPPELMQCNTLFDLASNSKMYATNFAIMHLVYQGKIDVNKPLSYYIPEYSGCDANHQCRDTRTVKDFLNHVAGYIPDPQFFNPKAIAQYGNGLYSQNRQLTESILLTKLPFARAAGGKPIYSDADYMLLGLLIEKVTGVREDVYVESNIYHPLGLSHTTYNPLANGFVVDDCAATEVDGNTRGKTINFPNIRTTPLQCQVHDEKAFYSMGGVSGHAGLFSDLHDMAVLTQVAQNNGSYNGVILWDSAVEKRFTTPLAIDDTFGLGWRRAGNKGERYSLFGDYASPDAFGHTGWTGTVTLIDPQYHLTIVLLTNKKHSRYANGQFAGDQFQTGKYAPVINLIYQALPNAKYIGH